MGPRTSLSVLPPRSVMVCGSAGKAFVVSRHCVYSITSVYFSFVGKEEPSSINRVTFVKSCCITLRLEVTN